MQTATRKFSERPNWADASIEANQAWDRHLRAVLHPSPAERPILDGFRAWRDYAVRYHDEYELGISHDGYAADPWLAWGKALRSLLNMDCGRFDCGTLDSFFLDTVKEAGFNIDNL